MVRLLAEVAASDGTLNEKRAHLMNGLSSLIQADCWVWGTCPLMVPDQQPIYYIHQTGGFTQDMLTKSSLAIEHPDTGVMTSPFAAELCETKVHLTRLRQHIVSNQRYETSPAYPLWQASDLGPLILSSRPMGEGHYSQISIYRRAESPLFTTRECKIAHIILTEVDWLHKEGMPHKESRSLPGLSPRCRHVMHLLLIGNSRKEIANLLSLSPHTVNDYVKEIFRHFGIHSTQELLARFRAGDGRDLPATR